MEEGARHITQNIYRIPAVILIMFWAFLITECVVIMAFLLTKHLVSLFRVLVELEWTIRFLQIQALPVHRGFVSLDFRSRKPFEAAKLSVTIFSETIARMLPCRAEWSSADLVWLYDIKRFTAAYVGLQ